METVFISELLITATYMYVLPVSISKNHYCAKTASSLNVLKGMIAQSMAMRMRVTQSWCDRNSNTNYDSFVLHLIINASRYKVDD